MKKIIFSLLAVTGMLMGSCSADDSTEKPVKEQKVQLDGTIGGGNGSLTPPPPPPLPKP